MNVGSLFSGVGGFDLGLERAGMRVLWQCEQDEFCQRVLACHWPGVPCYPDVSELRGADVESVDVLCGGFPCQDISVVGRGAGIRGERSGLWSEMFRLTAELRPRYLVVENVAALLVRGLDVVLADLASVGFDAEWDCLRASDFGAPHRRERIWLVAYPSGPGRRQNPRGAPSDEAAHERWPAQHDHVASGNGQGRGAADVADADDGNGQPGPLTRPGVRAKAGGERADGDARRPGAVDPNSYREPLERPAIAWQERGPWAVEPDVGRVADGVPDRVDRLSALGNALVPQIAEWIGRRILEWEDAHPSPGAPLT